MGNFSEIKERIKSEDATLFNVYFSSMLGYIFAIYNIFVGLFHGLAWNISMFAYYVCIASIRLVIATNLQKKIKNDNGYSDKVCFVVSSLLMVLLNILAIVPIVLMCLFM